MFQKFETNFLDVHNVEIYKHANLNANIIYFMLYKNDKYDKNFKF